MGDNQKKMIGQTISAKRKEFKLTQQELADKTELSRSYISDVEAGRYIPSVKSIVSISAVLKLDLNFLLKMTEIQ